MSDRRGFTLIELLAALIVLGAVLTITLPASRSATASTTRLIDREVNVARDSAIHSRRDVLTMASIEGRVVLIFAQPSGAVWLDSALQLPRRRLP